MLFNSNNLYDTKTRIRNFNDRKAKKYPILNTFEHDLQVDRNSHKTVFGA